MPGINSWPYFFILHINDLTKVSIKGAKICLYTNDTSIIVINPGNNGYKLTMNKIFHEATIWFRANMLNLNETK
jgi:hypothetical protein